MLRRPRLTLVVAALALAATAWPALQLGGEFMPPLDEGDLLYMPTALPGLSAGKAGELLQQTDRMIQTVPEVKRVFGKAGRADTATDPAPMEMFETTIQFKPRSEWRPGMTPERWSRSSIARSGFPGFEHLGAADPQPHRHAGHRHQVPGRDQGRRARTWPRSIASRAPIEAVVKSVPGVTRRWPSGLRAGATST